MVADSFRDSTELPFLPSP